MDLHVCFQGCHDFSPFSETDSKGFISYSVPFHLQRLTGCVLLCVHWTETPPVTQSERNEISLSFIKLSAVPCNDVGCPTWPRLYSGKEILSFPVPFPSGFFFPGQRCSVYMKVWATWHLRFCAFASSVSPGVPIYLPLRRRDAELPPQWQEQLQDRKDRVAPQASSSILCYIYDHISKASLPGYFTLSIENKFLDLKVN